MIIPLEVIETGISFILLEIIFPSLILYSICNITESLSKDSLIFKNNENAIIDFDIKKSFITNYQKNNKNVRLYVNNPKGNILKLVFQNAFDASDFTKYIELKYIKNDIEYKSNIDLIKTKIINNTYYFNVDNNIFNANKIWIVLTSRNKVYYYYLRN